MLIKVLTKPIVPALFVFGVLSLAVFLGFDSMLMPWVAGKFTKKADVPNIVGLLPEKAEAILKAKGLILMVDSALEFSPNISAGRIYFQSPPSGTEVKQGRRIWARLSKGLQSVELVTLRGMSLRQAEITLQQSDLQLGKVRYVHSGTVPAGAVIGSSPGPGTLLAKNHVVNLEISGDAETLSPNIPKWMGMSLAKVKQDLEMRHWVLGKVTFKTDANSLPQTVLSQKPEPGVAMRGDTVELVVSK